MFDDLVSELDFETKSSTKSINIKTDGAWTATSNESWIHVSPKSGNSSTELSISVDDNKGTEIRKGTVSVTVGAVTKYIVVQQNGAYLNLSTSSGSEIPAVGGSRTVTFSTSEDWTVDCKNTSWVSVDKTKGTAGVNSITLTFAKNIQNTQETTRKDTTYIRTKNSNLQDIRIITVQEGMFLYVSSSTGSEIPYVGGTRTITVIASDNWTVDCKKPWVSVDKTMGSAGTISIILSFSENPSYESRNDTTYIRTKNPDLQDLKIITTQKGTGINNNGHKYVDLNLPSGTLWATGNVGAKSPEEYGDYFAWGETTGYNSGKTNWGWSAYKWMNEGQASWSQINKYTFADGRTSACWYNGNTFIGDGKRKLDASDDAATVNWGGDWCMPTVAQLQELINPSYTTTEWTKRNGVNGYKITSKSNGKSIFLPAAGYAQSTGIIEIEEAGLYWPCELYGSTSYQTLCLGFGSNDIRAELGYYGDQRKGGHSVRPVINR